MVRVVRGKDMIFGILATKGINMISLRQAVSKDLNQYSGLRKP